jgi:hypothetical protein
MRETIFFMFFIFLWDFVPPRRKSHKGFRERARVNSQYEKRQQALLNLSTYVET